MKRAKHDVFEYFIADINVFFFNVYNLRNCFGFLERKASPMTLFNCLAKLGHAMLTIIIAVRERPVLPKQLQWFIRPLLLRNWTEWRPLKTKHQLKIQGK